MRRVSDYPSVLLYILDQASSPFAQLTGRHTLQSQLPLLLSYSILAMPTLPGLQLVLSEPLN